LNNLAETRADFPHADPVGSCTIFNIGATNIAWSPNQLSLKDRLRQAVLTHSEYDREGWKND